MKTNSIALGVLLLLIANAQGTGQPCSRSALSDARAGICVYNAGKKPAFASLRVVLDGEVRGELSKQQPWLWVDAAPGVRVVGIDIGRTPQARCKVQAAVGEIKYLRYESVRQTDTGFFDTTSEVQTHLREMSASDAASDLERLTAPVKRTRR